MLQSNQRCFQSSLKELCPRIWIERQIHCLPDTMHKVWMQVLYILYYVYLYKKPHSCYILGYWNEKRMFALAFGYEKQAYTAGTKTPMPFYKYTEKDLSPYCNVFIEAVSQRLSKTDLLRMQVFAHFGPKIKVLFLNSVGVGTWFYEVFNTLLLLPESCEIYDFLQNVFRI